eukprot:4520880-Alexandrium_andersonii.AAC.1
MAGPADWSAGGLTDWPACLGWADVSAVSYPPRHRPGAGWAVAGVPRALGDGWRINATGHLDAIEIARTGEGQYRPPSRTPKRAAAASRLA